MGRSYEETVQILLKSLRNAESQMRIEINVTLEKVNDFIMIADLIIKILLLILGVCFLFEF